MEMMIVSVINVILIIIILLFVLIVSLYRKQIRQIKEQIDFIQMNDTNTKITAEAVSTKEFGNLINSLNQLIERHRELELQLKKASLEYRRTITSVSHDLRTPLTSASGYLQMLGQDSTTEEKRKQYLTIIEERIETLKQLLEQLFQYARLEAEEYEFTKEKINVVNVLTDTLSFFYHEFEKERITPLIALKGQDFSMQTDKIALTRVFQNIIHNAMIHGEGEISITSQKEKEHLVIEIKNKTTTITKEDVPQIFERFYTSDQSRHKKTTGLGLSIAKLFVEQMHGTIEAKLQEQYFSIIITF